MARPCGLRFRYPFFVFRVPLCLCREAQRSADQERRMFERSEFAQLPLAASIAGCPGYAGVTDTRVAFSLGTFFWRRKRKYLALQGETLPEQSNKPSR